MIFFVMLNQFGNDDNWKAHYKTTGPEIWRDTDHKITHFVSAMGTTGTIMGTSTFLKEKNANIQIVGAQPTDCLLYTSPSPRDRQKSRMPSSA